MNQLWPNPGTIPVSSRGDWAKRRKVSVSIAVGVRAATRNEHLQSPSPERFLRFFSAVIQDSVRYEVLKSTIFWNITLLATCFHFAIILSLFFEPENGGDMFLRNVGWHSKDYTELYRRRWYSSIQDCVQESMQKLEIVFYNVTTVLFKKWSRSWLTSAVI
jgi:hypothetical protein